MVFDIQTKVKTLLGTTTDLVIALTLSNSKQIGEDEEEENKNPNS
jgi:hypothetical protein